MRSIERIWAAALDAGLDEAGVQGTCRMILSAAEHDGLRPCDAATQLLDVVLGAEPRAGLDRVAAAKAALKAIYEAGALTQSLFLDYQRRIESVSRM